MVKSHHKQQSVLLNRRLVSLLLFASTLFSGGCANWFPHKTPEKILKGEIQQNLTLSGKVIITADVYVPPGVTLTLAPGTTLLFQQATSSVIHPQFLFNNHELLVKGSLQAQGTQEQPIRFSGIKQEKKGWAGIILDHDENSQLSNCLITDAEYGLLLINSTVSLRAMQIERVAYGLVLTKNSLPSWEKISIKNAEIGISLPTTCAAPTNYTYEAVTQPLSSF